LDLTETWLPCPGRLALDSRYNERGK
jgi:hypothetical protein